MIDFIMYFVTCQILWWLMDLIFFGEITNELGGLIGVFIEIIYTIIYVILFVIIDYNWIDIFNHIKDLL